MIDSLEEDDWSALARAGQRRLNSSEEDTDGGPYETLGRVPVAAAAPTPLVNHPRYKLDTCLGFGGMGTVFRARHLMMDRWVALKVIHPELTQQADVVDLFRNHFLSGRVMLF